MKNRQTHLGLPALGFGIGLRSQHIPAILRGECSLDWFEIISENYLQNQGWRRHALLQIAERYPIVMHGVSLSIGSSDALDFTYLNQLKQLAKQTNAAWISDHVCWTGVAGQNTHDLLPMPLNETSLAHIVQRIRVVQDVLEQRIILENPSTYARFADDTMNEWEFISEMAKLADCGLLLDVNNVYVSSVNHGFDPYVYLDAMPMDRIVQMHLAGHRDYGSHILDTHDSPVSDPVWRLYRYAQQRARRSDGGKAEVIATLLEWDSDIPEIHQLEAEIAKAKYWAGETWMPMEHVESERSMTSNTQIGDQKAHRLSAYPAMAGAEFEPAISIL
jgi:uncharacterized protein (UPF0276 family)